MSVPNPARQTGAPRRACTPRQELPKNEVSLRTGTKDGVVAFDAPDQAVPTGPIRPTRPYGEGIVKVSQNQPITACSSTARQPACPKLHETLLFVSSSIEGNGMRASTPGIDHIRFRCRYLPAAGSRWRYLCTRYAVHS